MLQQHMNQTVNESRKAELYGEIIMKFIEQGAQKGAMYGAGVGALVWLIGALVGAPIGALAGVVLGAIDGVVVGYLVVYKEMRLDTDGAIAAACITASTIIITAIVMGILKILPIFPDIALFFAIIAGFATWHGCLDLAKWYEEELER